MLRDLERVREVSLIELLLHHLPRWVGSPLSVKSLSEVLQVAHESSDAQPIVPLADPNPNS